MEFFFSSASSHNSTPLEGGRRRQPGDNSSQCLVSSTEWYHLLFTPTRSAGRGCGLPEEGYWGKDETARLRKEGCATFLSHIWISSYWSQERRGGGIGWEEQAWECPTVKFLGHRVLTVYVGEFGGSLHRVTPLSQSSASNTNILLAVQTASIDTHVTARKARETFSSGLYGSCPSSFEHACVDLFSVSPWQQMSCLHSFQECCLRRCVQETVADAGFPCDRCATEAWQLLSCSCCPSVFYFFLLSLVLASCSRERLCLFLHHRRCLLINGAQKSQIRPWQHADTHASQQNGASFLIADPRLFACWTALCATKTWHRAVTNRYDGKTNSRLVILQLDVLYFILC